MVGSCQIRHLRSCRRRDLRPAEAFVRGALVSCLLLVILMLAVYGFAEGKKWQPKATAIAPSAKASAMEPSAPDSTVGEVSAGKFPTLFAGGEDASVAKAAKACCTKERPSARPG